MIRRAAREQAKNAVLPAEDRKPGTKTYFFKHELVAANGRFLFFRRAACAGDGRKAGAFKEETKMAIGRKIALFVGGTLFGSAGLKILSGRDARKVYAHTTAAVLRCKDEVMKHVELVQEGCSDILADAKQINAEREKAGKAEYIEESAEA